MPTKFWVLLILLAGPVLGAPQAQQHRPTVKAANRLIARVRQLMTQGKVREMRQPLTELVGMVNALKGPSSPEYAEFLGILGSVEMMLGDYSAAEDSLRKALDIAEHPMKPLKGKFVDLPISTRASLGSVLCMSGKFEAARDVLEKVRATDQAWRDISLKAVTRLMLGISQWQLGDRAEGRKTIADATALMKSGDAKPDLFSPLLHMLGLVAAWIAEDGRPTGPQALEEAEKAIRETPELTPMLPILQILSGASASLNDDPETARKKLLQSYQDRRNALGPDHRDLAPILGMLGSAERQLIMVDEAEMHWIEQERILKLAFGDGSVQLAEPMLERASLCERRGDVACAVSLAVQVRKMQVAGLEPNNVEWAPTLHFEAGLAADRGDLKQAEILERDALKLWRSQYPEGHRRVAEAMLNLVRILNLEDKEKEAAETADGALAIIRNTLAPGNSGFLLALVDIAGFRRDVGQVKEAHALLNEADRQVPEGKTWSAGMHSLIDLYQATTFILEENPAAAEPLIERAQSFVDTLPFGQSVQADFDRLLGLLSAQRGEYPQAEFRLTRALNSYLPHGSHHPSVIRTALGLSIVLRALGDYDKADSILAQMQTGLEGSADQSLLLAHLKAGRALLRFDSGDQKNAESLLRDSIATAEQASEGPTLLLAERLHNLAVICSNRGESKEARDYWSRAEEIAKRESGPDHPLIGLIRRARASDLLNHGSVREAVTLAGDAVQRLTARLGPDSPEAGGARGVLALARWSAGDVDGARAELAEELRVEAHNFSRWAMLGNERSHANLLDRFSSTSLYVSFHFKAAPQSREAAQMAFWAVLQRKGTLQDVVAEQARIERQSGPGATAIAQWKQQERTLAGCFSPQDRISLSSRNAGPQDDCSGFLARTAQAGQAFERAVSGSPALAEAARPVEPAALAAQLRNAGDFTLIEIVQYLASTPQDASSEKRYAAYILLPDGDLRWANLGSQTEIDAAVAKLRGLQSDRTSRLKDVEAAARALDSLVMQPIRPLLAGRTRLFVAADGALNLIDFNSLADEQGYLIDQYQIASLTSGRDLLRLDRMAAAGPSRNHHLFGNPAFRANPPAPSASIAGPNHATSACFGNFDKTDWTEIALSPDGDSTNAFTTALSGVEPHIGRNATRAALLSLVRPRSVWLLTHGFFCEDRAAPADTPAAAIDAMDRAALVMAGAASDDPAVRQAGYVLASDIVNLNWEGTELVVLGACETALGVTKIGDGVYGLRRALVLAGVRSQVMTMWQVAPESMMEVLGGFAKNLAAGTARLDALRKAQKEARDKYRHPFYWAGFYYMGDPGQ